VFFRLFVLRVWGGVFVFFFPAWRPCFPGVILFDVCVRGIPALWFFRCGRVGVVLPYWCFLLRLCGEGWFLFFVASFSLGRGFFLWLGFGVAWVCFLAGFVGGWGWVCGGGGGVGGGRVWVFFLFVPLIPTERVPKVSCQKPKSGWCPSSKPGWPQSKT